MENFPPNPLICKKMEASPQTQYTIAQFLPLIILSIVIGLVAHNLAKEKGRDVTLWTILGILPFINFFMIWYFVGASNLKHEAKLDEILSRINHDSELD